MRTSRLESFSDGVFAVLLTIMVLDLKAPAHVTATSLSTLAPTFLSYLLSYVMVAIIWTNHHNVLSMIERADTRILWLNNHLLIWVSFTPFVTSLVGQDHQSALAAALYGAVMCGSAAAFALFRWAIARRSGGDAGLEALHSVAHRRNLCAVLIYGASVPLAFLSPLVSYAIFVALALWFFVPRIALPDRESSAADTAE